MRAEPVGEALSVSSLSLSLSPALCLSPSLCPALCLSLSLSVSLCFSAFGCLSISLSFFGTYGLRAFVGPCRRFCVLLRCLSLCLTVSIPVISLPLCFSFYELLTQSLLLMSVLFSISLSVSRCLSLPPHVSPCLSRPLRFGCSMPPLYSVALHPGFRV